MAKDTSNDLEPLFLANDPEHGKLINIDGAIGFLKEGTTFAQREGYRGYQRQYKKLERTGLSGAELRAAALLAAMAADGCETSTVKVKRHV